MQKRIKLMNNSFINELETKKKLITFIKNAKKLSMDIQVANFEKKFSPIVNQKFSTFVNSGSSANLVLLQALKNLGYLKNKDKIGVSAITWSTNVMPIIQLNLSPIPIDINLNTLNCSPSNFLQVIKKTKLKAFFITNTLGFSDNIETIRKICVENNILLLEDNCESLGSEYKNKKLGSFGFASTHSFYVGHHISSIEGGCISTSSKKLNDMIKIVRAHGWTRNLSLKNAHEYEKKYKIKKFYNTYTFYDLAYNVRPTEINGFLALDQIKYLRKIVIRRQNNFFRIYKEYIKNPEFIIFNITKMNVISNFAFPIICKDENTHSKYLEKFKKNNIEVRPLIAGNITKQPFFTKYVKKKYYLPNADIIHKLGFYCPNNYELSDKDISRIILCLKNN
jgi:CDP-6-deoxy-D-xylo-4-hexulose-3-dehydrase